jgi:putative SOS response-associated peptidase YedK
MCLNFIPTQNRIWVETEFSVSLPKKFREEIYPSYYCPIIRAAFDSGKYICNLAHFGLIPSWAKGLNLNRHTYNIKSESMTADHDIEFHRNTFNARCETVSSKPSFRSAWGHRHFALVVIDSFMQPNYETGSAVRWRVHKEDGTPFALACLWERWTDVEMGEDIISFSILTRDASTHPLLSRFHKPGDAKRMPIIIPDLYLHSWLEASLKKASEIILLDPPIDLIAEPFPKELKVKKNNQIDSNVS